MTTETAPLKSQATLAEKLVLTFMSGSVFAAFILIIVATQTQTHLY